MWNNLKIQLETEVVYHSHVQTGWFTVWENGKQNSRLLNFIRESGLLFVLVSSISAFTEKQQQNIETGIKNRFETLKHKGLPFQMFRCSWKFSA